MQRSRPIRLDTVHRVTPIFVGHAGCLSGDTGLLRIPITDERSLSLLSGTDRVSIIPEIGFGDGATWVRTSCTHTVRWCAPERHGDRNRTASRAIYERRAMAIQSSAVLTGLANLHLVGQSGLVQWWAPWASPKPGLLFEEVAVTSGRHRRRRLSTSSRGRRALNVR